MDAAENAREQLWRLIQGRHPETADKYNDAGALSAPEVIRALILAYEVIASGLRPGAPVVDCEMRAGHPWDRTEDERLASAYRAGSTLEDLMRSHGRGEGGILSRIVHLGLASSKDEGRRVMRKRLQMRA